jgi:hypothetical protein
MALAVPIAAVSVFFADSSFIYEFALAAIVGFVLIMLFYMLYPVVVLGKKSAAKSVRSTVGLTMKNWKEVFYFSLIPFSVSILKYPIAFFISDPGLFLAFWGLVFLTGAIYTYYMVMNPYYYLKISA